MGSGGAGSETSNAEGETTKGFPCEVFVGGGDFEELALRLTLVPFEAVRSPLVSIVLELFRVKRPMTRSML